MADKYPKVYAEKLLYLKEEQYAPNDDNTGNRFNPLWAAFRKLKKMNLHIACSAMNILMQTV